MITPEFLQTVCTTLAGGNVHRPEVEQALREAFPGTLFRVCDDNDIPSRIKPLASGDGFMLYGINTESHCAALTSSPEMASGLAIALTDEA